MKYLAQKINDLLEDLIEYRRMVDPERKARYAREYSLTITNVEQGLLWLTRAMELSGDIKIENVILEEH
jgi:hypothetical protein